MLEELLGKTKPENFLKDLDTDYEKALY
jgi:hypothetical protein